jgi:hypothetical protein
VTAICVTVVSKYLYFEFNNVIVAQLAASQEGLSSVKLVYVIDIESRNSLVLGVSTVFLLSMCNT